MCQKTMVISIQSYAFPIILVALSRENQTPWRSGDAFPTLNKSMPIPGKVGSQSILLLAHGSWNNGHSPHIIIVLQFAFVDKFNKTKNLPKQRRLKKHRD